MGIALLLGSKVVDSLEEKAAWPIRFLNLPNGKC